MVKQTSVQLTDATIKQVKKLKELGFGTFTNIVRVAIDRMYREEVRNDPHNDSQS
jgi:4-hydroxy-3-methylbut-2-en-1-yl diphosphate synthase IspG/GcpE